jgi:hypothetical protein
MSYRAIMMGAFGAGALAPLAAPAPTTSRYRVDQTVEQVVDASAMGGNEQRQRFTVSTFLTVTLADTAGGKTVHAVVDSMRGDSATPVPAAVLDSARGVALHGFLASGGRLGEVKSLTATPLEPQLTGVVRQLFPPVRPGAKVGDGWADTTESSSPGGGGTMSVRRVTTYKATGSETRAGVKALRIEAEFTASVNGTQQTPSGPATLQGTGTGKESYFLAPDGRYLGGTSSQTSKLTISGSFAPKPLPVSLTEIFTVSSLR